MIKKRKVNFLLESVISNFSGLPKGKILDLGCGEGEYSKRLKDSGFDVISGDIDSARFKYKDEIGFKYCDITNKLPFADNTFDYVLLLEVIEHLRNPYAVISEINRIIKENGFLILSTPNILSLKSRFRFIFEGGYEYFREPPFDQAKNSNEVIFNLHLIRIGIMSWSIYYPRADLRFTVFLPVFMKDLNWGCYTRLFYSKPGLRRSGS